jgi:uncharacterized protein (DUF2141 family)
MTGRTVFWRGVRFAAFCLLASGASAAADNKIDVDITGVHNGRGQVLCDLFASADGFPQASEKAVARLTAPITDGHAECVFHNVAAGRYAVAVVHDENANGKLDRNFLGMPSEGVGTSRNVRPHFGPPKFEDAAFDYPGGSEVLPVTIVYLF